jgi:hypothetical protein
MRLVLALVVLLALVPAADAALIAREGNDPFRVVDANLRPVKGSQLRLPASTRGTVRSPDGDRLAVYGRGPITVRDRRTGRLLQRTGLKLGHQGVYQPYSPSPLTSWPSRHHLRTVHLSFDGFTARNLVRTLDIKRNRIRTTVLHGNFRSADLVGRVLRIVFETEAGYVISDIGAAGTVKRRARFRLPSQFPRPFTTDVKVSGDRIVASAFETPPALFRLGDPVQVVDLPAGRYHWAGENFIASNQAVARIGGETPVVERAVTRTFLSGAQPFAGGVIIGFGLERLDADLDVVYQNASDLSIQEPTVLGDRIYALAYECDSSSDSAVYIGSARSGRVLSKRPGKWRLGTLGKGDLVTTTDNADSCD